MIDKCFTHDAGQYRYELCLFDKVTQSGQDLGSYVGWKEGSNFREMEYKDGGHCWQGPKRSTLVKLTCSDKEEIVSIEEPSKCVYTMEFKTVSACNPAHVNALKLELMHLEGDDQ
jgi:protein kinase C substrate 80K-H